MARGAVGRIRPGNMGRQVAHHLPAREAALDDRRIVLAQRAQDQAPGFEHRRRREGWLGGRHVGSRFRSPDGRDLALKPRPSWRGWGRIGFRSGDRAHDRSRPKEGVRSRHASLAVAQHGRSDRARPRRSKLCWGQNSWSAVTPESGALYGTQELSCAAFGAARGSRGRSIKRTQYLVVRFLRCLPAPGHERVVRQRPGIANDINEQCTAACLTSNSSGHISAPPRWGAGSRRKPRRSLTTRTATSQAILAAEFFSRGRCALAAMPVHSLCADARQGWTRDGE